VLHAPSLLLGPAVKQYAVIMVARLRKLHKEPWLADHFMLYVVDEAKTPPRTKTRQQQRQGDTAAT
jgi:hypothetical protein